jgi:hypothetical protein
LRDEPHRIVEHDHPATTERATRPDAVTKLILTAVKATS